MGVGHPQHVTKVDRYGFFSDSYGHLDYFVDGLLAFEDQKRSAIIDDSHDDAVDGIDSLGWQARRSAPFSVSWPPPASQPALVFAVVLVA